MADSPLKYLEKLAEGLKPEDLDEAVHELKAREASLINNAGLSVQLDYLAEQLGIAGVEELIKGVPKRK